MTEKNKNDHHTLSLDARVNVWENDKVRGFASVVINGTFVIKDLVIRDGANGLWVSMPSKKKKDGEFEDIFHAITKQGREMLFDCVLDAYKKKKEQLVKTPPATKEEEEIPF